MAVLDTVAHRRPAGSQPFAMLVEALHHAIRQRALRKTRAELLRLSDSELDDIGLSRADVVSDDFTGRR